MSDKEWVMRIEPPVMTLGRALRQARAATGLSQKEVERQGGFGQTSLSQWERDAALPRLENLRELAAFYRIDPAPLVALLLEGMARREAEQRERELDLDANEVPSPALAIPERPGVREVLEALNAVPEQEMPSIAKQLRVLAKGNVAATPNPQAKEDAG